MDLDDTPEQAAYRAQVRSWLDEHNAEAPVLHGPGRARGRGRDHRRAPRLAGQARRGRARRVTWPKEYGGQGLGPIEQVICNQEIARAKVPGILDAIGVGMLGPTIIAHGTEEQKARYLGPMLHGDEVWCQLFSEPAAGSDLAAVQARARLQDDGSWRLTGQKVWTTNAQFASYGLLLARTDADVPKHKGLTMFIVPMDAAGRDRARAAPDLRRGRVQRGLLRRRRARRRRGRRRRRQRLGHGADDADVRARHDRPRQRGHGLQLDPLRRRDRRRRARPARPRGPPPARRDRQRTARRPLHRLPHADGAAERPDPRPRGRASRRSRSSTARSRPAT